MSGPEQTLATIEHFNVLFNQRNVDAVMELMTGDVVFENTSGGRLKVRIMFVPSCSAPSR